MRGASPGGVAIGAREVAYRIGAGPTARRTCSSPRSCHDPMPMPGSGAAAARVSKPLATATRVRVVPARSRRAGRRPVPSRAGQPVQHGRGGGRQAWLAAGRPAPPATPAASGPRSTCGRVDAEAAVRLLAGQQRPGPWAPPGAGPRRRPRPHHPGPRASSGGSGGGRPARRRNTTTPRRPRLDHHQDCPWWCDSRP